MEHQHEDEEDPPARVCAVKRIRFRYRIKHLIETFDYGGR